MEDIFHWTREGNAMQVEIPFLKWSKTWIINTIYFSGPGLVGRHRARHEPGVSCNSNSHSNIILTSFSFIRDDHGFSPLHWAAKEGHTSLVTLLIQRGARVNATNMGDDTPLHLATAHGHREIVLLVRFQPSRFPSRNSFLLICILPVTEEQSRHQFREWAWKYASALRLFLGLCGHCGRPG